MADPLRPTTPQLYMIDVRDEEPAVGSHVLALTIGGRTVDMVWCKSSHLYFFAWCPFPKVQQKTKDRMLDQFKT